MVRLTGNRNTHQPSRDAALDTRTSAPSPAPVVWRDVAEVISRLLDEVAAEFRRTPAAASPAMYELQAQLVAVKASATAELWQQVFDLCLAHPLAAMFHEDPFTGHCFRKPRGYAGDAELLDYLYGITDAPVGTTPLGRSIFNHMMQQQGALSVRSRGKILAEIIDETADLSPAPRILSIACGHLREGLHSKALQSDRIGEFVALDQDNDSLDLINRTFAGKGIRTVNASVKSILSEKVWFEGFDLVYAAGLYDYLSDRVAARLTRIMFDMLAPGGRLLVANFAPTLPEVAYMETFMDWKLIYRTAEDIARVGDEISGDEWSSSRVFWDEPKNIVFLELFKREATKPVFEFRGEGQRFAIPGHRVTRGSHPVRRHRANEATSESNAG